MEGLVTEQRIGAGSGWSRNYLGRSGMDEKVIDVARKKRAQLTNDLVQPEKAMTERQALKIAFVGQEEYFKTHYESDVDDSCNVRSFQLRWGGGAEYYKHLFEFTPDITVVFRGECMPVEAIERLAGIRIAYSTEPLPKILNSNFRYTADSLGRFKQFLHTFDRPYDYVFHYDEASRSFLENQGVVLSGYGALPIATVAYRPVKGDKTRQILFLGRSTEHRETILGPLKRDFDVLHLAHGWPGAERHNLSEFLRCVSSFVISLNLHAENEISWEPRAQQCMACGALVVSEKISQNDILQPGTHFIEASDAENFYRACRDILADPIRYETVRMAGLAQVQKRLAAKTWWPTFFDNVLSEAFGRPSLESARLRLGLLDIVVKYPSLDYLLGELARTP